MFSRDDVISVYTRDDAINDGVLVDLMQGELGDVCRQHYKYPIACTAAVWGLIEQAVNHPKHCNDCTGILHDMLHMSKVSYTSHGDDTRLFTVIITGVGKRKYHRFKIACGPGDSGEPVLTIILLEGGLGEYLPPFMLPDED